LGEILENKLFKGKRNYERTMERARSAGRRVKWMCASEDGALLNLMRTMIIATVISRIRAGLALTSLTHSQYQTLDAVVGGVIKETMALGYHVSARAALALMGLRSMKSEMELEKLRIFGRANTTAAGPLTRQIMERRRDQIDEGTEKKGFLYDVAQILKRERLQKHWRNSKTWSEKKLNKWKTKIKTTMDKSDAVRWKRWLATKDRTRTEKHGSLNNNLQWTMPKLKGKDAWKRMNGGSQIRNALFITWMTGAANLRSNKTRTESDAAGRGNRKCRLCGGGSEDEWHLLDECEKLDAPRHLLWNRVDKLSRDESWRTMVGQGEEAVKGRKERMMVKLFKPNGMSKPNQDKVIEATKNFLVSVHRQYRDGNHDILQTRWTKLGEGLSMQQVNNATAQGFGAIVADLNR
jgi:hypothetical protein